MTGKEVKKKLLSLNLSMREIAERCDMSPQALNTVFNVEDVKTGFLEKLSTCLSLPMSFFYPEKETLINNYAHNVSMTGTGTGTINDGAGSGKDETISRLFDEIAELRKTNQKLVDRLLG